jgi:hypothetical protein
MALEEVEHLGVVVGLVMSPTAVWPCADALRQPGDPAMARRSLPGELSTWPRPRAPPWTPLTVKCASAQGLARVGDPA